MPLPTARPALPIKQRRSKQSRKGHLRRTYGITEDTYIALVAAQQGFCGVCFGTDKLGRRLAVDHDHDTGAVRSPVCGACNQGLGAFRDDPRLLGAALVYLAAHGRRLSPDERAHLSAALQRA